MNIKPKQGDTLYLDVTKVSKEPIAQQVTVTKVGTKYFYVDNDMGKGYNNQTLMHIGYRNVQLYRTEQEIHDMHRKVYLRGVIYFDICHRRHLLDLDQLQRISNILNEKK